MGDSSDSERCAFSWRTLCLVAVAAKALIAVKVGLVLSEREARDQKRLQTKHGFELSIHIDVDRDTRSAREQVTEAKESRSKSHGESAAAKTEPPKKPEMDAVLTRAGKLTQLQR